MQVLWRKLGFNGQGLTPWFDTTKVHEHSWKLPKELGNKGLVPRELFKTLVKSKVEASDLDKKQLTKLTIKYWRTCVRGVYFNGKGANIDLLKVADSIKIATLKSSPSRG